ncbi:MAG: hypothetical protein AAFQ58_23780 [Pseudomonadota bacterium]
MSQASEFSGHWLKRVWWLRGVIAAVSLIGALDFYLQIPRKEYLAPLYVILREWNTFVGGITQWMSDTFSFPELSADAANTLLLMFILVIPSFLSSYTERNYATLKRWMIFSPREVWIFISLLVLLWITIGIFGALRSIDRGWGADIFYDPGSLWGTWRAIIAWLFMGYVSALAMLSFLYRNPSYVKGMLVAVSFIGTLTLFYLLDVAFVRDWFNEFACNRDLPAPHCATLSFNQSPD